MSDVIYHDVPLMTCRHWFTGCWFKCKILPSPVYVLSVTHNKLIVRDCSNLIHIMSLEDLDIFNPNLGNIEYFNTRNLFVTTMYLTYNGRPSYKKGLDASRIMYKEVVTKRSADKEGNTVWNVVNESGLIGDRMNFSESSEIAYAVFNKSYRSFCEATSLIKNMGSQVKQVALSENLSIMKSTFIKRRARYPYLLIYKGTPIAHLTSLIGTEPNRIRIDIDKRLGFLVQHIQEEIKDVQIVRT